jgi:stage V sporulation protein R
VANLTPELSRCRDETRELAARYGLDCYEVIFELVDHDELNMVAAYGGFPTRYPHWRFGMEFEQLCKGYAWGLSRIYELVINNDPCYAYLMRSNSLTEQKLVMAHVYGHCDFFKNNLWFSKTSRKMMDVMANHGARVRRYMDRHGVERVENFIDTVLSLDNLIDVHAPYVRPERARKEPQDEVEDRQVFKIAAKDYMDRYINPPQFLARQRRQAGDEHKQEQRFPSRPVRDALRFLLEHAPLQLWEQDTLAMLREEAYYFAPQGMTKIMNEGWAVYWHSMLMTRHLVEASEIVNYADVHSGTLATAPGQINPYKLGVELWRDVEERWNRGKFGADYDACDDADERRRWDKGLALGREKIFQVRKIYNDVSFIDEYLNQEFAERQRLYNYAFNPSTNRYEVQDRDWKKVKDNLLNSLTNFGQPIIWIADANYKNRGELYLYHDWAGADLEFEAAQKTLQALHGLWKRPVHIETREGGKGRLLSFEGEAPTIKEITGSKSPRDVVGTKPEKE